MTTRQRSFFAVTISTLTFVFMIMDISTLLFGPEFLTLAIDPLTIAAAASAAGSLLSGGGGDEKEQAAAMRQRAAGIGEDRASRAREQYAMRAPLRREHLKGAFTFGDPTNPFNRAPESAGNILEQIGALEDSLSPNIVKSPPQDGGFGDIRNTLWAQGLMDKNPYMGMSRSEVSDNPQRGMEEAQRQQRINDLLGFGVHR